MYDKYKDKGLEILAFPSNQFGYQEPDPVEKIRVDMKVRGQLGGRWRTRSEWLRVSGVDEEGRAGSGSGCGGLIRWLID